MDIWKCNNWQKIYENYEIRSGLRLKFDKNVDSEVRRACKEFCEWLRLEYKFPMRIPIYVKSSLKIKAMDGEMVYGTFFGPYNILDEPYIKVAVGDYQKLLLNDGKDNALASYLGVIAHELTHYFQWLNQVKLTDIGEERQASRYCDKILEDYAKTREHP